MKNPTENKNEREAPKPLFDAKERAEIVSKFNIGRVVRKLSGDAVDVGYEAEIGAEYTRRETEGRRTATLHGGYAIPDFVLSGKLRTMTGVTNVDGHITGNGAALVATDLQDEIISPLMAKLVLTRVGVRYLEGLVGDVAIPKGGEVTAHWLNAEDADAQKSNPTFSQITATPHTCAALVEVTRKLALQTSPTAQAFIADLILKSNAKALEVAAFAGTGSDGEPLGLINTSGVASVSGITPGSVTRDNILDFIAEVEDSNADTDNLKWVMPSRVKTALKKVAEFSSQTDGNGTTVNVGTKHLYQDGKVDEYIAISTNNAPAKQLILGDWSQMCVCRWGKSLELIADPYSLSASGAVRLVSFIDADVVVCQPGAFAKGQILA